MNTYYKNLLLIDRNTVHYEIFSNSTNADTFPIIYSTNNIGEKEKILLEIKNNFKSINRLALCFTNDIQHNKIFLNNEFLFDNIGDVYNENTLYIISLIKEFNIKYIDFLACNTLNYKSWNNFFCLLKNETGVIVGASNDKTGNLKYGTNWIMESTMEDIKNIYFTSEINNYSGFLDTTIFTTLLVKQDNSLWGSGLNNLGQLGLGDYDDRYGLNQINLPNSIKVKSASSSYYMSAILTTDNKIYTTGANYLGGLGLGDTTQRNVFTYVNIPDNKTPIKVRCFDAYMIVLMEDNTVYGTGANDHYQLGLNNDNSVYNLVQIPIPDNKLAKDISLGQWHMFVLMTDGTLYGTGYNHSGQLSIEYGSTLTQLTQINIPDNKTCKIVSTTYHHTLILTTDNILYGCGLNTSGELLILNTDYVYTFTQMNIDSTILQNIERIDCNYGNSYVVSNGNLYGWGSNSNGQLGLNNNYSSVTTPTLLSTSKITYIQTGISFNIVLDDYGNVYGSGKNDYGQLGTGDNLPVTQYTPMINGSGFISLQDGFDALPITNICFAAGSIVKTDQGDIPIELIDEKIHTINKHKIICLTKTISTDKDIIFIKKNALDKNIPNKNTKISRKHKILYNNELIEAYELLNINNDIKKVNYNGEILYNILLNQHTTMLVNNIIAETLNPKNILAQIYSGCFTNAEIQFLIKNNNVNINNNQNNKQLLLLLFTYEYVKKKQKQLFV